MHNNTNEINKLSKALVAAITWLDDARTWMKLAKQLKSVSPRRPNVERACTALAFQLTLNSLLVAEAKCPRDKDGIEKTHRRLKTETQSKIEEWIKDVGFDDSRNLLQTLDTYMPPKHDPLEIAAPSSESIQGPNISQLLEVFPKLLNLADQSLTEAETAIQQDQSNLDSDIDAVLGKIQEIVKASEGDEYIYRGEREHYDKICSSLYRHYERDIDAKNFEIQIAQAEMVKEAMNYTQERHKEAVLTELQHYGGKTNLIDFTTDYLIALFFACDGSHDDDGRVLLLKHTEENKSKYSIVRPQHPQNRVIAQKSIFVQPPEGFIVPNKVIKIPRSLKKPILDYLGKHHDISTKTIYNDLHGFIKYQGLHESAYVEFYKGVICQIGSNFEKAIVLLF